MVINLFPTSYDSLKEMILGLCVLACFAIRSIVEVVEFSKHYIECFMDDENHINKIQVKITIAPLPTTPKVSKKYYFDVVIKAAAGAASSGRATTQLNSKLGISHDHIIWVCGCCGSSQH